MSPTATTSEVLIVGGGPGGAAAAIVAARAGCHVRLIDRARFPRDKCCGDGLTTGALRRLESLGLDPSGVPSWKAVDDVHVVSTRGYGVTFPLPRGHGLFAAVARRAELDHAVLELARACGVDVVEGVAVQSADQNAHSDDGHVTVRCDSNTAYTAPIVVGADGMWSTVRRSLLRVPESQPTGSQSTGSQQAGRPATYLGEWHGYRQYFANTTSAARHDLWVWFEPDLAGGYVWAFPLAGGVLNVGFGLERRPGSRTRVMKDLWPDLLARPHIRAVLGADATPEGAAKAWPIPAAIDRAVLTAGRALFVGDAARACDLLTGEGIGQALQTGMAAGDAIAAAFGQGAPAVAAHYEHAVRNEMTPDHRMAWALQRMMRNSVVCRGSVRLAGTNDWTRRNFARWLFEDYPRGIALTPRRWRRGLMSGEGAFTDGSALAARASVATESSQLEHRQ